ncbi:lipase [Novymonas esmeraldas]|uniref:Lipase n=1 Tax=Novymonas esmeraldas TaxID=1808958 RepID=A0AAW0F6H2_9TRYP
MKRAVIAAVAVAAVLLGCVGLSAAQQQQHPYVYNDAYRSHLLSRASYCDATALREWSCGTVCNSIPGFVTDRTFQSPDGHSFGFSGVDHTNRQIILALRGTRNLTNWLQNLKYFRTPYTLSTTCGSQCLVHRDLYDSYRSVRTRVTASLLRIMALQPEYQLIITGHSFGGALAVLAAVDLHTRYGNLLEHMKPMAIYTFGAPRVGNPDFTRWADQLLANGPHYRLTHARDPVPHLPPMRFGYLHAPTEVFYRTADNSSMRVCVDSATAESKDCSNSLWAVSISDHLKYLGEPTGCTAALTAAAERDAQLPVHMYVELTLEHLNTYGDL